MRGLLALVLIALIVAGVVFMGKRNSQAIQEKQLVREMEEGSLREASALKNDGAAGEPEIVYVEDELIIDGLSDPEIRIDLKNIKSIEAPMERVKDASALNGEVITVPEAPNKQTLHAADRKGKGGVVVPNGKAVFEFKVDVAGDYVLWAHKRWGHSCADSFRFAVDDGTLIDFISDSNYAVWEWATLPKKRQFKLEAGVHQLTIANREDGFRIDSMVLTTGEHEPVSQGE